MLKGKKVLIGITGSIAAYKIPLLVRQLMKEGVEVKIIMTQAAGDFVSSLTLSTLSRSPVLKNLFDDAAWSNHVALGRWADLMVVAPLSCHSLSKMAHGQCDNLLMATYLSATCPVVVAPAMDEDMWKHGSTKTNLLNIERHGCMVIPVEHGELASGLTGDGRMAEPETIVRWISEFFTAKDQLAGKKILVTAGPTYEALDPVRFIGNHSSGKMGFAIAEELGSRGAHVVLVSGPVSIEKQSKAIELIRVTSAQEMFECCLKNLDYDIAIMAAAVADYRPAEIATQKIKKQ
ncbi:MAG TPA: bifunctional phosphopantothenoylcysteine decarboxylase/phosphopantothenate--cysteine ligase CoaBC, partial [Flavisolibacter sp.]|nr:bifunctional phosphopantothenoylcysteine decarboxylase/phosphopantothenate--cysteine ligase CoaBC [Flavisolibacter sp.]